ncbi:hypothetical protein ZWY2020_006989 [Hordeum vulgare]|nr:hypothetical protein ZWY2020_006989 [Hordeum vulgare]
MEGARKSTRRRTRTCEAPASLVYGGLGAYITWRWCKLRRTEDRVRASRPAFRHTARRQRGVTRPLPLPPHHLLQPSPPPTTGPGKPPPRREE